MGNRQSKTERGARLPSYLTRLISGFEHYNQSGQHIAQGILHDLVAVICDTSAHINPDTSSTVRVNLLSQRTESRLRTRAQELMRAMNIVYPCLGASLSNNFTAVSANSGSLYLGYFSFPLEQIARASSPWRRFPIRLYPRIEPVFP